MTECYVQAAGTIELYFYGELDAASRTEAKRHLARCAACRQALEELNVIRSALAARPDVAAPPAGDWSGFMARLDGAIQNEPRRPVHTRAAPRTSWRSHAVVYAAMAALFAIISVSVAHIVRSRIAEAPEGVDATVTSPEVAPRTWSDNAGFASLAEHHFDRSKLVVLGLANKNATDEKRGEEWEYERELASSLLADTRLYRLTAEDRGFTELARTLQDLELVLLQTSLANDREDATLEQIQRLIRKRDLVTRMNVVAAKGM